MLPGRKPTLDTVLARLAISRDDKEAWTLLYDLLWTRVFATTFRILRGHRDRAEDASQEVFIRLIKYCDFRKLLEPGEFQRYLHTVAENVAYDYLDEMRRLTRDLEQQENAVPESFSGDNPEEIARVKETVAQLWSELDVEERALANLLMEGRTVSEIAQHFGWNYSNAGVRIHRLRERLRKSLKEKDFP